MNTEIYGDIEIYIYIYIGFRVFPKLGVPFWGSQEVLRYIRLEFVCVFVGCAVFEPIFFLSSGFG